VGETDAARSLACPHTLFPTIGNASLLVPGFRRFHSFVLVLQFTTFQCYVAAISRGASVTAAFAMITSKTGNPPPLALRGRAGHD
jgi:hypothetical protein